MGKLTVTFDIETKYDVSDIVLFMLKKESQVAFSTKDNQTNGAAYHYYPRIGVISDIIYDHDSRTITYKVIYVSDNLNVEGIDKKVITSEIELKESDISFRFSLAEESMTKLIDLHNELKEEE